MKKSLFIGVLALIFLVQTPFIYSLDSETCQNISEIYREDCYIIADLDLSDEDQLYLLDNLDEKSSTFDIPIYQSLFTEETSVIEVDSDYDVRESLERKFNSICKMIVFCFVNYSFYKAFRKYFGGALWNVE